MQPDEPNHEEQKPFQPADPPRDDAMPPDDPGQTTASNLDDTHPVTDTGVDSQEQYDEGGAGGAEAHEPNAGNTVAHFNPPVDDDEDKADSPS